MTRDVSDEELAQLGQFLAKRIGLDFSEKRLPDLRRSIGRAARDFGFKDLGSCADWLVATPLTRGHIETLASHLTIGETYFFRDEKAFKTLEEFILPNLIETGPQHKRTLRIWSAGCSTGEEPYSVAILLRRIIPDYALWNITILGTDINAAFLKKASAGIYTDWSFRGTPPRLIDSYFLKIGRGRYELRPEIKKSVKFAYHNLAEDPYPSLLNNTNAMNIIFCRNVLMYFHDNFREKVMKRFPSCLVEGGWLLVSPAETPLVAHPCLEPVNPLGTIIHRKLWCGSDAEQFPVNLSASRPQTNNVLAAPGPWSPVEIVGSGNSSLEDSIETFDTREQSSDDPLTYGQALEMYEQGRYADIIAKVSHGDADSRGSHQQTAQFAALLARAHANNGFLSEAQFWCGKATESDKLNPIYHYLLATILLELGEKDQAMNSLQRAIYLDQNFVVAHFAVATLARTMNRPRLSRKHFSNVLSLLEQWEDNHPVPESEGMTAGRLKEIVLSMTSNA